MFQQLPRASGPLVFAVLLVPLLLLGSGRAAAQEADQFGDRPRVEGLRFEGAESLPVAELRGAIITEPSRCRSLLLRPVCWLTDWHVVVERNYLEREELPRDELRLRVFYARRGFREVQVSSELRPAERGVEVVFRIEEGEPTRIEAVEVVQAEPRLSDRVLRRSGLPRAGQRLDLVRLDTALTNVATTLGERGYLDAAIRDTVEVRAAERSGRIEIWIEPGARSVVGDIDIEGNQDVSDGTIRDAMRLREGRPLRTTDLAVSQRSLYESDLFHEARLVVPPQEDSVKRLEVAVREAPPRAARLGGGFNTFEFVQAEGRLSWHNWMGGGRRLTLRGTVGNLFAPQLNDRGIFSAVAPANAVEGSKRPFLRPTWIGSVDLMQPAFRGSANTLGVSAFMHRRLVPAVAVDRGAGAELSVTRRIARGAPATLSYRWERTAVEAGDLYFCVNYGICDLATVDALRQPHRLSPFSLDFFADRADDPLGPTRGYRARLELEHASELTGSNFHYYRASGAFTHYQPLDFRRRHVLAGRLRAGWVRPLGSTGAAVGAGLDELALLHPRKRFYAGGSRSVRGYGENQLGPRVLTIEPDVLRGRRDENGGTVYLFCEPPTPIAQCDPNAMASVDGETERILADDFVPRPVGGTSVVEANVEYRFPVWGPMQGALFVDGAAVGGPAGDVLGEGRTSVTPGFGARFPSPVGPIRIDLGIRTRMGERLPVVTEAVDEDGVRELVLLERLRDYDRLDDASGFLARTLARLTLHLSIGEAF